MKHAIDPTVDCVFKALLGSERNKNLLVHFINATLSGELEAPVTTVEILNPYNDKTFMDDKLSIVDVKARDDQGSLYQLEIQLLAYAHLPSRMLYTWADLYASQLGEGDAYVKLQPTYAIWLLGGRMMADDRAYVHGYKMRDDHGQVLLAHGGIWVLELEKFHAGDIVSELERWLRFFKEGERLDDESLPEWMMTREMRQAMGTLRQFSEQERDYHAYQSRQHYIREQRTLEWELEHEREEKLRLLHASALERQAAAERQAETERQAAERQAETERQAAERQAETERQAAERQAATERQAAERQAETERQAAEREHAMQRELDHLKALLKETSRE